MRISTANAYDTALNSLMDRQSQLSATQEQMTTGLRVNHASDDPAAAARAERARASEARSTASQRAVDASKNAMTLTESGLGDANDLLQSVREDLVKAGNASYTDADRASIADDLSSLRQQLLAVANSSDGSGNYLFGGQAANQPPFVDAAGGVQYQGTGGSVQAPSGETLPLTVDGQSAWMQARTGNGVFTAQPVVSTGSAWISSGSVTDPKALTGSTYSIQFSVANGATTYSVLKDGAATAQTNLAFTAGQSIEVDGMAATISGNPANGDSFQLAPSTPTQSVFATLDKAISDLKTPGRSNSQIAQDTATNVANTDSVLGQIQTARSQVGATLNRIDGVESRLSASKLASQTDQSNAEDLDMVQAVSDFNNEQTGYDAALKAYGLVQRLSLFNYISTS